MRATRAITLICLSIGFGASSSFAQQEVKAFDKKFFAVSAALIASSVYDVETTFSGIKSGRLKEGNPLMVPFVNSGRPAYYSIVMSSNAGALYFGYRFKKSSYPQLRRFWWIVPITGIVIHGLGGSINLKFVL